MPEPSPSGRESRPGELAGRSPSRRDLLSGGLAAGASLAAASALSACSAEASRRATSGGAAASRRATAGEAESDESFPELSDQRSSVAPIQPAERAARRARLGELLASRRVDALLLEGGATMTYLAGVKWGKSERFFGLVVLADGSHFWICPAFEESRARAQTDAPAPGEHGGPDGERGGKPAGQRGSASAGEAGGAPDGGPGGDVVAWQEDEYFARPLAAALASRRVERIAVEPSLRYGFAQRLAAEFGDAKFDGAAGAEIVASLRMRKDVHELAIMRRANELTLQAIEAASRRLVAGMSGSEVAALVNRAHKKLGLRNPWNLSLIGPAAALPHGEPDERRLARGDVVLVDAGGELHEYQSDDSRTWVFDAPPTAEVERAWYAVHDAQRAAFDAVRPGTICGDVDRIARKTIVERGYPAGYAAFTHRLGHGIGLEGHEDPYFDSGSTVVLASGMTLSDEPGLYFPGRFGVRLEDIVVVTDDGADHFGTWQRGPTSPA